MDLDSALASYTTQLRADGRSVHTQAQAQRHVRLMIAWLAATGRSQHLDAIGHGEVAAFLASPVVENRADGGPRKATSANSLRSSLRAFFSYCHGSGIAPTNAGRLVRRAMTATPPPRGLSDLDQERLLGELDKASTPAELRDRVLFAFLLGTGARIGSTLAARIEDLDLEAAELRLRREKGRRERTVYLPDRVVVLLREHVGDRTSGHLFDGMGEAALTARHVARRLRAWCERADVRKISPHGCRHSFATRVHAKTGDLLVTKAALGHVSISSTAIYATVSHERLREAVAR